MDQHSDYESECGGNFCGHAGEFAARKFVLIGEPEQGTEHQEARTGEEQSLSGDQPDGETEKSDEREGADSAETVAAAGEFVFFAFESNEKREKKDEDDLCGFFWNELENSIQGGVSWPPRFCTI